MFKLNTKLIIASALCTVLLAACGGGGDSNGGGLGAVTPPPAQQTITSVVDFIKNLIASNGENTDPIDINSLTLAADDTSEPVPVE
ncbi:MAG: hypothetical protein ABI845_11150 [Polaromonas sp.]